MNWGTQTFDEAFKKINKVVTVKECESYTKHYDAVLLYMFNKFKTNDLFKYLSRGAPELGGSYANRLKTILPDDFDTNIIFKLPKESGAFVSKSRTKKDLVEIRLGNNVHVDLKKLMDSERYLLQNKLFNWFKSIFYKVLNAESNFLRMIYNLNINGVNYHVKTSERGPALILKVELPNENNTAGDPISFDINIVASFLFDKTDWKGTEPYPTRIPNNSLQWAAIPTNSLDARGFRASYRTIERDLIHNHDKMKSVIRLMKKMRDTHGYGMVNFSSYYIDTIFMLYDEELIKNGNENFWMNSSITKVFETVIMSFSK